jgi:hypothetical protein
MKNTLATLQGKKTYITAAVLALLNLAVAFNLITPDHLTQINFILTALGLGALRSAVGKA